VNLTRLALAHPYAVIALVLLVAAMGVFGYLRTPVDLFPETAPPQVVVITIQPGASADDVEDKITEVIEKEINTLSGLENLRSTSRDAVSSIMAEFRYTKPLGEALLDVQNAIARVHGDLPAGVREPRIYRLTEASSRPLLTLALRPKEGSTKTWMDVRLLAENQITDRILALSGIADVDVFGGHRPEVRVSVDRDRLVANGVGIEEVIGVLARQNVSAPAGTVYADGSEYLIRTAGEFARLDAIRDLPIRRRGEGLLRVGDVATVELAEQDPRSIYHGNGQKAVALGIMRPDDGPTVEAIERFKQFLPRLRAEYPDIAFEITQDQQPLIDLNLGGMRLSIVQAIALTVAVIFLFLADVRAALVVGVSIPLAFLFTLSVLWLTPLTLNMVTLTGLIVAIGMVVDCSVVALENIYRHYDQMERPDAEQAAREGTNQIALAITAGMLTTVAVLVPIIFIGGYPQRTIGRVALTISTTLVASLVVAVTLVPLVASRLLTKGHRRRNLLERAAAPVDQAVSVLRDFYLYVLRKALRWRVVTLLVAGAFLLPGGLVPHRPAADRRRTHAADGHRHRHRGVQRPGHRLARAGGAGSRPCGDGYLRAGGRGDGLLGRGLRARGYLLRHRRRHGPVRPDRRGQRPVGRQRRHAARVRDFFDVVAGEDQTRVHLCNREQHQRPSSRVSAEGALRRTVLRRPADARGTQGHPRGAAPELRPEAGAPGHRRTREAARPLHRRRDRVGDRRCAVRGLLRRPAAAGRGRPGGSDHADPAAGRPDARRDRGVAALGQGERAAGFVSR